MADIDNLTEINENFDTVKTLLNSIRAQGILNTSDVDKLLSGINSKLEKINTEEDIDLIKAYLTELKQNLDERHNILVSKFGAIEALFSNLLKNSNELPKSAELKELFDVVATNLSVFSREVVSQKETLTDITLRLDALRSDDSQKKDIIKNITLLKPDLERLNNGFDSIVLSLNDNFKTIVKTITSIDKSEYLDRFATSLSDIDVSNKAIISAVQILDKKSELLDETLNNLVKIDDFDKTDRNINELKLLNQNISENINDISSRYSRIDALADKVDASVNIIASLKTAIEDSDNENTEKLIEKLNSLKTELNNITTDTRFDEFKTSLSDTLKNITDSTALLDKKIATSSDNIDNILSGLNALDIHSSISEVLSAIDASDNNLKSFIHENSDKLITLNDANISRVLNEISANADSLGAKLNQAGSDITMLCETSFDNVFNNITELKNVVSQLDENGVSANNAMFSNISDRLDLFETTLKNSLEYQENSASTASAKLYEQVDLIKNISNVLDYKMDSSVVEISEMKKVFDTLKSSVDNVLALNFNDTVKDLRADLYASKQDIFSAFENSNTKLSEDISNDLYAKYELLISKLDSTEDSLKNIQASAMNAVREILDKISASLVDIISYVSESKDFPYEEFDRKLESITVSLKETNLNYIENVRDVVDVIRAQVESNLKNIEEESSKRLDLISSGISETTDSLRNDIKNSYEKLLEIQGKYENLQSELNNAALDRQDRFDKIITKASSINDEFNSKLVEFKSSLFDKINEFKQELTVDNAGKISEFKFSVENLYNKNTKEIFDIIDNIKSDMGGLAADNSSARENALASILGGINTLKELINGFKTENNDLRDTALGKIREKFGLIETKLDNAFTDAGSKRAEISEKLYSDLNEIKTAIDVKADEASRSRTGTFAKLLENFTGLKEFMAVLNDKSSELLISKVSELKEVFNETKNVLNTVDENVDRDMTRQLSIIESNFESLISQINILSDKTGNELSEKIKTEFADISEQMNCKLSEKLESYKQSIETAFDNMSDKANSNTEFIQQKVYEMNAEMKTVWAEQSESNYKQINEFAEILKSALDEKIKLSESDYNNLREEINEFTRKLELNNEVLTNSFKERLDEITKYVESILDTQSIDNTSRQDELRDLANRQIESTDSAHRELTELKEQLIAAQGIVTSINEAVMTGNSDILGTANELSSKQIQTVEASADRLYEQIELAHQSIQAGKDFISDFTKKELAVISANVEKETDIIIAEVIEQFEQLKKANADELINLTSNIESVISEQVYNNIEDLKSYLDVKTDGLLLSEKLDSLRTEMTSSFGSIVSGVNKMLEGDVFNNAMSDFRLANEILVNTAADKINEKVETFIKDTVSDISGTLSNSEKEITEKLSLFDKKFTDTVVDKYEEIKLISNNYNNAFDDIKQSIYSVTDEFVGVKTSIAEKVSEIVNAIENAYNKSGADINELKQCFENLREQISNKTFEEAFQTSLNRQLSSLESLINQQLGYIGDINELCSVNLPDVTELNALVKGAVLETLRNLSDKIESQDIGGIVEKEINTVKSDIITQIINIFNQISFVTEQEEILDFIQEKHDELISVLSHIVTETADIGYVKDSVSGIESAVSAVRDDIDIINEKIDSIISSSGDSDYVYSLQDIEADIANLRIAIQEIKDNSTDSTTELKALIEAADKVSSAIEDMPSKNDLSGIAEDLVSISTRTNKLILASDESYKTLQDNLQEFKLVIDDLDERTRNFAQESGMDRIDSKLNTLNNLVQNGAKSNQVFNEVFEYLAEWVDKAGNQIDTITDKVETLDDIGQIKVMLEDLKADAADNSENVELIEALGNVFDKQAKKISSLEAKLDKMIVETTIAGKSNKLDTKPMEDTLNKFLVAMDEKISLQQNKISSLEEKLSNVMNLIGENNTAQLTKKMGGMDKQIAKLNKSIEKIASHVVEK